MYSVASKANSAVQTGTKLVSSESVGWTSALLDVWRHPAIVEEYSTVATPDQTLVLTAQGRYKLESYSQGVWRSAEKGPGMGGATAPMHESRLRIRSLESTPIITFQMYLPAAFLREAGEEYRRAGQRFESAPLQFMSGNDPLVFATVRALVRSMEVNAPDLYCNSTCRSLATHLLLLDGRVKEADVLRYIGRDLTDRRLLRVLEFMQQHASQMISLDELAREAGISRFHFARLFKLKVGVTPHAYLMELRLTKAATLLLTSDFDITAIASQCGYSNAGRFAHAFRLHFQKSPSRFRDDDARKGLQHSRSKQDSSEYEQ